MTAHPDKDAVGNDTAWYSTRQGQPNTSDTFTYDALYRLTNVNYNGAQSDSYTYDAVGNRTMKNGQVYSYDNADQLTNVGGIGGTTFQYDNNGNQTYKGADNFAWDRENRLTGATVNGAATNYTYNGDGLRVGRNVVGGSCADYTSLWPNNPTPGVVDSGDTGSYELGTKFRSSSAGYVCGVRFYKATTNTGTHFARLWTATGTLLATATFTNETASGWQSVNFATPVAVSANTDYIVSYCDAAGHLSYTPAGFSSPVTSGTLTAPAGTNGYYAIGAGNAPLTEAPNDNNYWVDVKFAATINAGQSWYTWDVAGGLPMLLQDGTKTYVYGDRLLYTVDGTGASQPGTPTWLFGDKLGSTATLVNAAGTITGTYTYDVFGAVKTQTGATTEFSFTAEQNDPNGLTFLRARYYDPSTGRFLSRDPLGGMYRYARNNPVNLTDASGLCDPSLCGGSVPCPCPDEPPTSPPVPDPDPEPEPPAPPGPGPSPNPEPNPVPDDPPPSGGNPNQPPVGPDPSPFFPSWEDPNNGWNPLLGVPDPFEESGHGFGQIGCPHCPNLPTFGDILSGVVNNPVVKHFRTASCASVALSAIAFKIGGPNGAKLAQSNVAKFAAQKLVQTALFGGSAGVGASDGDLVGFGFDSLSQYASVFGMVPGPVGLYSSIVSGAFGGASLGWNGVSCVAGR